MGIDQSITDLLTSLVLFLRLSRVHGVMESVSKQVAGLSSRSAYRLTLA